jgi:hypothetical protein
MRTMRFRAPFAHSEVPIDRAVHLIRTARLTCTSNDESSSRIARRQHTPTQSSAKRSRSSPVHHFSLLCTSFDPFQDQQRSRDKALLDHSYIPVCIILSLSFSTRSEISDRHVMSIIHTLSPLVSVLPAVSLRH